jgi:hypothetical protein
MYLDGLDVGAYLSHEVDYGALHPHRGFIILDE